MNEDKRSEAHLLVGELRCAEREFPAAGAGFLGRGQRRTGKDRGEVRRDGEVSRRMRSPVQVRQPLHTSEVRMVSFVTVPWALILMTMVALMIQLSSDLEPFRKIFCVNEESSVPLPTGSGVL